MFGRRKVERSWEERIAVALERIADCMEARVGMEVDVSSDYEHPYGLTPVTSAALMMSGGSVADPATALAPIVLPPPSATAPMPPTRALDEPWMTATGMVAPSPMQQAQAYLAAQPVGLDPESTLVQNTGAPLPPPRLPDWMQPVENGRTPDAR